MRNKNHNKRINHNNGLKIAIMLLGVMVGQGRVMCVTEGLGEGTATGSQGGAAIPALPFLRTFPADSMRNTGRGRGLRQELNTSRPQRASSLGVTPSSSSNELYPSVAPGSQVKPGQRWNRNAPLPRLQWGQPGGPAAADAPASPTPRSRSPEGSTPGVGSGALDSTAGDGTSDAGAGGAGDAEVGAASSTLPSPRSEGSTPGGGSVALDSTAGDGTSDAGAGGAGDAEVRAASPTSRSPSPLRSPIVPAQVSLSRGPSLVSVASIELRDAQDDPAGDGAGFSQDPSSPIVPAQVSLSRSPRSEGSTPGVGSSDLPAADAPASPTPRSRSPERSGSGVGSHGPTPRSPRPEECTHINMAGDSDQEDEEFEMFEGYEALSPRRQKAKLELEEKLTKTELDASGSNDGEVKTDEEGIDKILKRDNMPFLLEKRMILDILSTHFDQKKLAPFSTDFQSKGLNKDYESLKDNVEELRGFINSREYMEDTNPRITPENILELIENSDDDVDYDQIRRPQILGYKECCNSVIRYLRNILKTITNYIDINSEIISEEIDEDMMKRAREEIQHSLIKKNIEMQRYEQTLSESHKKLGKLEKMLNKVEAHLAHQNQVNRRNIPEVMRVSSSNETEIYGHAKYSEKIMTIEHTIDVIMQLIDESKNDTDKVKEDKLALELTILELQNDLCNLQPIYKQVRKQIEKPYMDYASSARKELEALIAINELLIQDA